MEKQELEIRIDADGVVSIEVIGAQGKSCLRWTHELEESLGAVIDRQLRSEYYQADQVDAELGVERDA